MRAAAVAALVAVVVLNHPAPTRAQESPTSSGTPSTPPTTGLCDLRKGSSLCAGLGNGERPVTSSVELTRGSARRATTRQTTTRWERVSLAKERGPGEFVGCTAPLTGLAGTLHKLRRIDTITGRVVQEHLRCVTDPIPSARRPDAVSSQRPPAERIWSEVPLPEPTWGLSPGLDGLTGLPTHLWDPRGGAPVSTTVDLGGFTATATARPVHYEWTMWEPSDPENRNPHPVVSSLVPGSESKPAATYTYETKGDYTVTQTVTWAGTYRLTGPGVNEVVDLGTTTTTSSRTYHVTEVRAVLRG